MKTITLFLLLLTIGAAGQKSEVLIRTEIKNTRTQQHIRVPGTRVYLIPPVGFSASEKPGILQKEKLTLITVTDSIGDSFYAFDFSKTKDVYKTLGALLLEERTITVQGYAGRFFLLQASKNTQTHLLIFGDKTFCTKIITVFPISNKEAGDEIIQSLNTLYYEKEQGIYNANQEANPFSKANFSVDDTHSKYKFSYLENDVYTFFLKNAAASSENSIVMAYQTELTDTSNFELLSGIVNNNIAHSYGLLTPQSKRKASSDRINNYRIYQVEMEGPIEGKNNYIYNIFVAGKDKVILLHYAADTNNQQNLAEFKKLVATIQIK